MKKLVTTLLLLAVWSGYGYSQTWRPMGPDNYNQPSLTAINALTRIALSSTGVPYIVFSDFENSYRLTVRKYNGSTWETVGNAGFTMGTGTISDFDIAVDNAGIPYVSYPDPTKSRKISVLKFNGSSWELVGSSGFTTASGYVSRIATTSTGTPYVATQVVGTGIIVMQYNGTAWAQMGGVLAATGAELDLVLDNDVAYVTYRDGSADVSVKKFNGTAWELVGTTKLSGGAFNPTLAFNTDHVPYVAYADYSIGSTGQATVKKYNGTTWETVGSALFSSGQIIYPSLAFSGNTPYVVYGNRITPKKADVMTYNGTNWVIDGSAGLSEGEAKYTNIAISSTGDRYIAFGDEGHDNKAVVMKHNGSNWANLGATCFSAGAANYLNTAVDANGSTYSVYQDAANAKKATVMKYNGSSWSLVGSAGFTVGGASYTSIALDASGTPYVAFRDSANSGKATVMKYSGSSWAVVGTAGFSAGAAAYTDIAIDGNGIPYVVYQDAGNGLKASVMKYDGSSWIQAADNSIGMTNGQANYTSIAINSAGNPYVICTEIPSNVPHLFYDSGYLPGYWFDQSIYGYTAEYTSITIDANNKPYIAFKDLSSNKATVLTLQPFVDASLVGTAGFSADWIQDYISIAVDGSGTPYIAYAGSSYPNRKKYIEKFNGSIWEPSVIAEGSVGITSISINGGMVSAIFKDFGAWGVKSAYSTLTTQASNVSFTAIDYTQFTASWNNGNGSKRAAFIKQGSGGSAVPVNASTYTANATFGLGSQIGSTGWYCIYNGTGSTAAIEGLSIGTSYRVFVAEYNGAAGSEEYLTTLATGNPKNQSTNAYGIVAWDGSESTDWNTAANWSSNAIPLVTDNVTVPLSGITNFPVMLPAASGSCHNLIIETGASLTLQSNVSGTGSLITTGTVTGNMTIQRFVAGNTVLTANKFHLVSIPLHPDNVSLSNLFLGSYLYEYLPVTNAWHGMNTATTTELSETVGYMIYYPNVSNTYQFTGASNNGPFTPAVTYAGNTAEAGNFALVPNPYPSNIDWNAASGWTKTNIGTSIWVYNNGNYGVWNGASGTNGSSRYIGVGQAFFVQTTAGPALTMDNSVRTHTTATFLKNGSPVANQLRVRADANTMADELLVGFGENTSNAYNANEDALKLQGAAAAPQLYTLAGNAKLSINNLTALNSSALVPMNFETEFEGNITLNFSQMESFPASLAIKLEDKLTNQVTDLRTHPAYTFAHQSANASDRFVLHFGSANSIGDQPASNGNIWISNKSVTINSPESIGEKALVEIFNAAGQVVFIKHITLSQLTQVPTGLSGFAVVRVSTDNNIWVAKAIF